MTAIEIQAPQPPDVALRLRGLSKRYPGRQKWTPFDDGAAGDEDDPVELADDDAPSAHDVLAIDSVNLVVTGGSLVGVVGEKESGKTTLLRLVAGTLRETSGLIEVAGRRGAPPEGLARLLEPKWSGQRNLDIVADFLGLERRLFEPITEPVFASAGLSGAEGHPVGSYPPGASVALVHSAMLHAPLDLYLFDGPPKSPDETTRKQLDSLLRQRLAAGASAIMTARRESLLPDWTHYVVMLNGGRILSKGPVRRASQALQERFVGTSETVRVGEVTLQERLADEAPQLLFDLETLLEADVTIGVLMRGTADSQVKFSHPLGPLPRGTRRIALTLPDRPDAVGPYRVHLAAVTGTGLERHSVAAPNAVIVDLPAHFEASQEPTSDEVEHAALVTREHHQSGD